MAKIKDAAAIAEKWSTVTPQRSTEYQKGVQNPRTPWAAAAAAAGPAQAAGVQAAIANKSFEKGIARAGDAGWQRGATTKGPARFAEGVALAGPDYQAGFGPYADVIRSTQLPQKFARGDPRNLARVEVMSKALRARAMGK